MTGQKSENDIIQANVKESYGKISSERAVAQMPKITIDKLA